MEAIVYIASLENNLCDRVCLVAYLKQVAIRLMMMMTLFNLG